MKPRASPNRPQIARHGGDGSFANANGDALALGFAFAQANAARELGL